ncbi:hypothetical protein L210DRAFT_3565273 [Boletus edulis BED1]|uniref:Uncharacterized protein n=1 Tax=Boletus edulis BED1 TaxID=1328754 RepID=A0AAD4BGN0_BOLED|nr:hypothetical protein L210DRAFT_3565273 [Boletus edulis BED1]
MFERLRRRVGVLFNDELLPNHVVRGCKTRRSDVGCRLLCDGIDQQIVGEELGDVGDRFGEHSPSILQHSIQIVLHASFDLVRPLFVFIEVEREVAGQRGGGR